MVWSALCFYKNKKTDIRCLWLSFIDLKYQRKGPGNVFFFSSVLQSQHELLGQTPVWVYKGFERLHQKTRKSSYLLSNLMTSSPRIVLYLNTDVWQRRFKGCRLRQKHCVHTHCPKETLCSGEPVLAWSLKLVSTPLMWISKLCVFTY